MSTTHKELAFSGSVARGTKGKAARQMQEWLCLNDHAVAVDGDYGPATEAAVRAFQAAQGIGATGRVTRGTFEALTAPMGHALTVPGNLPRDLNAAVVAIARRHLVVHPREVGGQNRGPWVRLYMDGHEGGAWPWCAGFVSFVIR
jgi:peptidoglycan hydrolase-like protein with peptidoglycan-binding domain